MGDVKVVPVMGKVAVASCQPPALERTCAARDCGPTLDRWCQLNCPPHVNEDGCSDTLVARISPVQLHRGRPTYSHCRSTMCWACFPTSVLEGNEPSLRLARAPGYCGAMTGRVRKGIGSEEHENLHALLHNREGAVAARERRRWGLPACTSLDPHRTSEPHHNTTDAGGPSSRCSGAAAETSLSTLVGSRWQSSAAGGSGMPLEKGTTWAAAQETMSDIAGHANLYRAQTCPFLRPWELCLRWDDTRAAGLRAMYN